MSFPIRPRWTVVICLMLSLGSVAEERRTLEWSDLLTLKDRQKMAALPEIEHTGEEVLLEPGQMSLNPLDSTDDNSGLAGWEGDLEKDAQQQWQEVLMSNNTVAELDGKDIRISGFIVPLEFNDDMVVTEFFLVPYFGACIHVPPPPPNQLIYVTMDVGIVVDKIYDPFWVNGRMTTEGKLNETGYAAYSLKADKVELYYEEE